MATRIECVNKQPREDPHKQIENVGGYGWKSKYIKPGADGS
jgi:hypothetical protein